MAKLTPEQRKKALALKQPYLKEVQVSRKLKSVANALYSKADKAEKAFQSQLKKEQKAFNRYEDYLDSVDSDEGV